jgi:hypothetical protein
LTRVAWFLAIWLSLAALLAPALWNGFPLVFADTGGYLARAFEGSLDIGRSALYGAFLAAGVRFNFWPNVVVQAALTLWIIALAMRAHGLGGRPILLTVLIVGLSALTSLPWYVGQLMPDIFLPLAVLAIDLLAFRRGALARWEIAALITLVAVAIALHMTILALALALTAAFALCRLLPPRLRLPRAGTLAPAAAVALGLLLAPLSNLAVTGQFAFTPGGTTFLFGRLLQDGIVARYLAERCPDEILRLCAYRDRLPTSADDWLWNYESPLHRLGWWRAYEPEANRIIGESLLHYPGAHLATATKAALAQLMMLRTGEGMHAQDNWHAEAMLARFAPLTLESFRASAQQQDRFDFAFLNLLHVPLAVLCTAGLLVVIALRRCVPGASASTALAVTVLLAVLANAGICGIFSNPNDRYQSRIAWLAPFALATIMLQRRA